MMKTKLFFLFSILFFLNANAQIVNIPDARFKQILLTENCVSLDFQYQGGNQVPDFTRRNADLNGNGEIEVSEAEQIKFMFLNFNNPEKINSLEGIKYFKNLVVLNCGDQYLNQLDLSGLSNLKELICSNSNISTLNLTGASLDLIIGRENHITSFDFNAQNQLRYFDFSENANLNSGNIVLKDMPNLYQFTLENCNISNIDISNIPKLEGFSVNYNPLPNLNLTPYSSYLKHLGIAGTGRTSLDLSAFTSLQTLNCSYNNLGNLDISNNINLTNLNFSLCSLNQIHVSNNVNLINLNCQGNNLTSLDVSKNTKLENLNIHDNSNLSELNINGAIALKNLYCNGTNLASLDVSNNKQLEYLLTGYSPFVNWNLKNGKKINVNYIGNFGSAPKRLYLCCDEENKQYYNDLLSYWYPSLEVNSYCSSNPGGSYNTILGNAKIDLDKNGCNETVKNYPNLKLRIDKDDFNYISTITNQVGNYKSYTFSGNYTITPILENLNYFTVTPSSATINFADTNNNIFTQNFCVIPNGTHNDLEVQFAPVSQARPGFDATYRFIFLNKGNTTLSGNVNLDYQGSKMSFVSSELPVDIHHNSNLLWYFTNLKPFEQKSFLVTFKINSPTHPTNPVNAGDKLFFWSRILPIIQDETPLDNLMILCDTVVNSLDPNDKTCLEGDIITAENVGNDVHYLIRFENVGTANAVNVVVKDIIDTDKFDVESLLPIKSSHLYRMTITEGNKVEFFFENIQLPFDDANNDGYILFKIKTKPNLVIGDTFSNKADIYFDYNFPIATNQAITTVQSALGTQEFSKSEISVYPNPVKDVLNFSTKEKINKAEIYDVNGRLLKVELGVINNQLNVSTLKTGNYIIKVSTKNKSYQTKFIKQ